MNAIKMISIPSSMLCERIAIHKHKHHLPLFLPLSPSNTGKSTIPLHHKSSKKIKTHKKTTSVLFQSIAIQFIICNVITIIKSASASRARQHKRLADSNLKTFACASVSCYIRAIFRPWCHKVAIGLVQVDISVLWDWLDAQTLAVTNKRDICFSGGKQIGKSGVWWFASFFLRMISLPFPRC